MRVTAEALAHHGMYVERRLEETVDEVGREEFGAGGGGLREFSQRMVTLARHSPVVRELVVVGPDRQVIRRFGTDESRPCLAALPVAMRSNHEHGAGRVDVDPVGCLVLPVDVAGAHQASVFLHVSREWSEGGTLVRNVVRQTALQLAPVFAGFYLLLGGLLVVATRAAHRWRRRAAQGERIEALGALATGINHEIKNPLNALGLCLQVLKRRHTDAESQETLAMADAQSQQIVGTLDEFARFTRVAELTLRDTDLAERMRQWIAANGVSATVVGAASARIDEVKFDEAVTAMLDFLARHRTGEEPIELRLGTTRRHWSLTASVAAAEFETGQLAHVFDPYLRTRPRDVGRGLAWARAVIQAHEGDVNATYDDARLELRVYAATSPGE